jgi:O-antigen ligase
MWVRDNYFTPHNGFLLIAVTSGIIPIVLFCAYFLQSGLAALRANALEPESIFYLPLVFYALLITFSGNLDFMTPWAVVSLAMPLSASITRMNERDQQASLRPAPT